MTRAFVTGAAGFIGRHLCEQLVTQGWEVMALCRPSDPAQLLPSTVQVRYGDITTPGLVMSELVRSPADATFHLAGDTSTWARDRRRQWRVNVDGTNEVVQAVEVTGGRLVHTSSTSAFGMQPGVRLTEASRSTTDAGRDNYGGSKRAAERLIEAARSERGLDAVILNPANVLGPYDVSNWSKRLILPIANGGLRFVPPGSATWVAAQDVAAAHIAAASLPRAEPRYLLGGVEASFLEVVNTVAALLGQPERTRATSPHVLQILLVAATIGGAIRNAEPALTPAKLARATGDLLVDDTLARQQLNLQHRPLDSQLEQTIDWLRQQGLLQPRTRAPMIRHREQIPRTTDWRAVPVEDEPDHVELAADAAFRVYRATIRPGSSTLSHRHTRDTCYVVTQGGTITSEEPSSPGKTKIGRSTPVVRKLGWLASRTFGQGWITLPTGTVLVQPHEKHPLEHRVHAGDTNTTPVQMIGVELHRTPGRGRVEIPPDWRVEHRSPGYVACSTDLRPRARFILPLDTTGALVVTAGTCRLGNREMIKGDAQILHGGDELEAEPWQECRIVIVLASVSSPRSDRPHD